MVESNPVVRLHIEILEVPALKFGKYTQHLEHGLACSGGGVETLLVKKEALKALSRSTEVAVQTCQSRPLSMPPREIHIAFCPDEIIDRNGHYSPALGVPGRWHPQTVKRIIEARA